MKTIRILFVAFIALFLSCKKNGTPTSNSLMANVTGTTKNFNMTPLADKTTTAGITQILISGEVSSTTESIVIHLDNSPSGDSIVAGTYTDAPGKFAVNAFYQPLSSDPSTLYGAGSSLEGIASFTSTSISNHFKLVITSISSSSIMGTFTGDFYKGNSPTGAIISITNGTFDLPLQH